MKKYTLEMQVGLFVLVGILCLGYITIKLGKMEFFDSDGKTVTANFSSVTGLKAGASVEIGGVPVGKVTHISLLSTQNGAKVTMLLQKEIALTEDSIASVKTSGLIGDKYISLSLGAGQELAPGEALTETESALDIESMVSKYIFGGVK